jgi:hypothetical protein
MLSPSAKTIPTSGIKKPLQGTLLFSSTQKLPSIIHYQGSKVLKPNASVVNADVRFRSGRLSISSNLNKELENT